MRGSRGSAPPPPTLENHKNIGFLAILVRIPLKSQSYQASIQCRAIIGTPAKRRLKFDHPHIKLKKKEKKNVVKVGPTLTKLFGSAHADYGLDLANRLNSALREWSQTRVSSIDGI